MKRIRGILVLLGTVFLLSACQLVSRPPGEKVPACAQEDIILLEPGWQVAWSARIENGYIKARPYVIRDYLIVIDRDISNPTQKRIRAYHLHTGKEVWRSPWFRGYPDRGTLRIASASYIAGYANASTTVFVWHVESGELAAQIEGPWVFSLALDDQRLYVHDYFGNFRAYNLPGGKLAWERQLPEAMRGGDLFVTQGRLVVSLLTGLWILDTESGQTIAQFPPNPSASTWLYEDTFMVGDEGAGLAFLQAVSIETGELVWRERYWPFITYEPPAYSDGILYFPGGDNGLKGARQIMAVALESGDLLWTYQPEEEIGILSGIAISNSTGYVILSDGTLRAIDLKGGQASVILRSNALYDLATYWTVDNGEGGYRVPGVAVIDGYVFASFGCQTVYALRMPEQAGK